MSNTHKVVIPECYESFPDDYLLDTRDVMQIMGFKTMTSVSALKLPVSGKRDYGGISATRGTKNLYRLGDLRRLRDKRAEQ